jgi:hypothetical protein
MERLMPVRKLPEMVACTKGVVVTSDSWQRETLVTLTLRTEDGELYLLPLSDQAVIQLSEVIGECRRTRDFADLQEIPGSVH